MQEYINRIFIGAMLLIVTFLMSYYSPFAIAIFVLALSCLSIFEFKSLVNKMGIYPRINWLYFFSVVFIVFPLLLNDIFKFQNIFVFQLTLLLAAYLIIFSTIFFNTNVTKFQDITASLWAIFHLALLPSYLVWIRLLDNGFQYFITLIITVSVCDISGLFFGKLFGKHKLAPHISPNKTVEGSSAALVAASLSFFLLAKLFHFTIVNPFYFKYFSFISEDMIFIIIGFLISVLAQLGDLLVSVVKRAAGVKDTSRILLSHGGVLDRVDSHFFVTWLAFLCFAYLMA